MSSIYPDDGSAENQQAAGEVSNVPEQEPALPLAAADSTPEQPVDFTISSPLPPEAQGETNGGPLGCCLGVTIGIVLSLVIAVLSRLYADPLAGVLSSNLTIVVRIVMGLVALVAAIVCGYLGWKIGKRLYREYDPPVVKDRRRSA